MTGLTPKINSIDLNKELPDSIVIGGSGRRRGGLQLGW